MNVFGPLAAIVASNSTANALFSGRIYPQVILQGATYPAAAITIITTEPTNTKTTPSNLDFVRVQVDVYGNTITAADQAAKAFRDAVDYFAGSIALNSGDIATVGHIQFEREMSGFAEIPEVFRIIQEYSYSHKDNAGQIPPYVQPTVSVSYDDDAAAKAAGLSVGSYYLLSDTNLYGLPGGVVKQVTEE